MSNTAISEGPQASALKASVWKAFSSSLRANVLAEIGVQTLRVSGTIVLARILHPSDFGIYKALFVVATIAILFTEGGLPDALIQRKEISPAHEATAWWLSLGLVSVISGSLYFVAPYIASAMRMPALTFDIRLLCIPILLEGLSSIPNARLRRKLKFSDLALADVFAEITFLAVALALIAGNYARYSLAGGLAARYGVHAVTVWSRDTYIPKSLPSIAAARDLTRFSVTAMAASLAITCASNADYILVGRLLGSEALGIYTIAWDVLKFVSARVHRIATRVLFPAFSRLQDHDDELSRAYVRLLGLLARIVLPITLMAVVAAPEMVTGIYGPQWIAAAMPVRLLALGMALFGLREGIGTIYYAKGHPAIDIYLNGGRFLLIIVIVAGLSRFGLPAVAAGVSVLEGFVGVIGITIASRLIHLNIWRLLVNSMPKVAYLMVLFLPVMILAKLLVLHLGASGPQALVIIVIPTGLAFLMVNRPLLRQIIS
ncbi:MAG: lipopolysaccharide biosynthesis protein [Candidatus Binataceae bacterium]|nr:lipopolysaccharide biosynthesis protein [Candidatus Binataceae bacterium]